MPRRKATAGSEQATQREGTQTPDAAGSVIQRQRGPRLLLVAPTRTRIEQMAIAAGGAFEIHTAHRAEEATTIADSRSFDAAVVWTDSGQSMHDCLAEIARRHPTLTVVAASEQDDIELVVRAVRAGAADVLRLGDAAEWNARITAAAARTAASRERAGRDRDRVRRLRASCTRLAASRHELMTQFGRLCGDFAKVCKEMAAERHLVAIRSEFEAIVRQELELESLLRTILEYTLRKTGPTNAAIFLPSSTGDFSLGAYANYDCPRESAESMLDQLCGVVAAPYAETDGVDLLRSAKDIEDVFGDEAPMLENSTVAVFSCWANGECLAVVTLFRDRQVPFTAELAPVLEVLRSLIGAQLARVVRTHNRHQPKDKWSGMFDDPAADDDIDLAA